ncbi:hypothetical protein IP70_13440 [alpha proteobacterium AAP38]|nr:hypothetical protein IP70_13440 [alpha proteobacterium AAP38]
MVRSRGVTVRPGGGGRYRPLPNGTVGWGWQGAMSLQQAALTASLQDGTVGDQPSILQDLNLGGGHLYLHDAPAGAIGHGIKVAGH